MVNLKKHPSKGAVSSCLLNDPPRMVHRSTKAKEARAILQRFGVDINDATNGVFLPTQKGVPNSVWLLKRRKNG